MNKKEKDYTGFPGDCSENQLKALENFKKVVASMGINDPKYDDAYLLRFLRARKFDLDKTTAMWKKFIDWRKENNVDEIDKFTLDELPEVKKYYSHGYFRTDKEGRPVYIERIGLLDIQKLFKVTTQERLVKYYTQSYERLVNHILPSCAKAAGKRVDQSFTILDLKGASMGMASGKVYDFIKLASSIGQDYYPEILGKMYIVNAPFLFTGVWAVIKPWIDEKTRNKIKILGSSFQKELLAEIDANNLPDFLGGKVTVNEYGKNLDIEQGPWVTDSKQNVTETTVGSTTETGSKVEVGEKVEGNDAENAFLNEGQEGEKQEEFKEEDEPKEDNAEDINALKEALAGMNLPGGGNKKKGNAGDDQVGETPLNTMAGEDQ